MNGVIELVVTCGPIILAMMGTYVSIRPPVRQSWVHWAWFVAFALVGGFTATCSFLQQKSTDRMQVQFSTTQQGMAREIDDLENSVDRLVTGVGQISRSSDYPSINEGEGQALVDTLRPFTNKSTTVNLSCLMSNAGACRYAEQWLVVLRTAGWQVTGVDQGVFMPPPYGVFITVKNPDTPGAGVIQRALSTTGITATGRIDAKVPENVIRIVVGAYKPPN